MHQDCHRNNFEKVIDVPTVVLPLIVEVKGHNKMIMINHYASSVIAHYHISNMAASFRIALSHPDIYTMLSARCEMAVRIQTLT